MALARAKKQPGDDGLLFSKLRSRPAGKVDKSTLTHGEPERIRDAAYRESAQGRACECCGMLDGQSVVACHVNTEGAGGKALKAGDDLTLFLCTACHHDMDTDPRGIPVWIVENIVKPWLRRRYRAWCAMGERGWRSLNAAVAIAITAATDWCNARIGR